jgi:hypothetical protein
VKILNSIFNIQDYTLSIDIDKTKQLYSQKIKIVDDCKCEDCRFYSTIFIKEDIEIFELLTSMGVDLEKNIGSGSPGVWCVIENKESFLYCEQDFQLIGHILSPAVKDFEYNNQELGFQISAVFVDTGDDMIRIYLTIQLEKYKTNA